MTLTFYIVKDKNKRLHFISASALDLYIKTKKLPPTAGSKPNGEKSMTRDQLKEALTAENIPFKSGLTKV